MYVFLMKMIKLFDEFSEKSTLIDLTAKGWHKFRERAKNNLPILL